MKKDINLLPDKLQKVRNYNILSQQLNHVYRAFQLGLTIITATYFFTLFLTYQHKQLIMPQQKINDQNTAETNITQQVQSTNRLMQTLHKQLNNRQLWTPLVVEIIQNIPDNIVISKISFEQALTNNEPTHLLQINGIASSPEAVSNFKLALKNISWVSHIDAPLTNLTITGHPDTLFTFNIYRSEQ